MKLKMIGLAAFASLALSAGMAAAEMQPIPNPPEKAKPMKHHKMHHHMMKKEAEGTAADKKEDKAEAKGAMAKKDDKAPMAAKK